MKVKTLLKTAIKGTAFKVINSKPNAMFKVEEGTTGQKYIHGSILFNDYIIKSFNIIDNVLIINV